MGSLVKVSGAIYGLEDYYALVNFNKKALSGAFHPRLTIVEDTLLVYKGKCNGALRLSVYQKIFCGPSQVENGRTNFSDDYEYAVFVGIPWLRVDSRIEDWTQVLDKKLWEEPYPIPEDVRKEIILGLAVRAM